MLWADRTKQPVKREDIIKNVMKEQKAHMREGIIRRTRKTERRVKRKGKRVKKQRRAQEDNEKNKGGNARETKRSGNYFFFLFHSLTTTRTHLLQ